MKITESFLKKPLNKAAILNRPMLFARMPEARIPDGSATITYNIGTGHWFVEGQVDRIVPYVVKTFQKAIMLMKTINHYNKTGERKIFENTKIELELF